MEKSEITAGDYFQPSITAAESLVWRLSRRNEASAHRPLLAKHRDGHFFFWFLF